MNVLVTGANGFVGHAVLAKLARAADVIVHAAFRSSSKSLSEANTTFVVGDLGPETDWTAALRCVDAIVHCAARVHVMNDAAHDPMTAYRHSNVEGTVNFARQAAKAGIKRFIFISSIKVNGEGTVLGAPYTAEDTPTPLDPYGISKLEAERELRKLAAETGMEVVIVRPVLVYGPGVKANFLNMMKWLYKGIPLPLGAIHNKRSFVALDNLVDLIVTCIDHPKAANQTFLVSDGEDLSTTDLLRRMGRALGRPARLAPIPQWMLEKVAVTLGKRAVAQRLCGSLQVDIGKTCELLQWRPPFGVDDALRQTAEHFLAQTKRLPR